MKIENLHIRNVGPFKEARIEFATTCNPETGEQPVTIITGVNGAGKSIVIDAIRAALSGQELERNIVADEKDFVIEMDADYDGSTKHLATSTFERGHIRCCDYNDIAKYLRYGYDVPGRVYDWVIDYWSSKSSLDSFKINNLINIKHAEAFVDVMTGKKKNVDLVNFICQMDYLHTSEMDAEKAIGRVVYDKLKEIVNACLDNGKFKYVRRTDLTPIVEQNGTELSLEKLSSGNIFLIENLLSLMCKMYSVSVLNQISPERIFETPGLLLIDEVETHLHPKWQKRILRIIRKFFPNVQIILTTHSPFVVASMDGARIYTCIPEVGCSKLRDETEKYGNLPIDEILTSAIFGEQPFNEEITELIRERRRLIEADKKEEAKEVARKLYKLNPEYFSYLNANGEFEK